jgi:hypothetical protein
MPPRFRPLESPMPFPHPRALRGLAAAALLALPPLVAACGSDDPVAPVTPVTPTPPAAQLAPAVRAYIDTALLFTEQVYFYGDTVNWPAKRTRTFARAGGAQTFAQAHPAIDTAVRELGDPHSFFYPPSQTLGLRDDPNIPFYRPASSVVAPRIGYLWLPSFGGRVAEARADSLQRSIASVDSATDACGWIIDQRGNLGGFWPVMLVGIAPLITEGRVGGFVERDPTWRYFYFVRDGAAGLVFPDERTRRLDSTVFLRQTNSYACAAPTRRWPSCRGRTRRAPARSSSWRSRTARARCAPSASRPRASPRSPTPTGCATPPRSRSPRPSCSTGAGATTRAEPSPPDQPVSAPGPVIRDAGGARLNPNFAIGGRDAVVDAAIAWLQSQPGCRATADVPAAADGAVRGRWVPTRGPAGVLPEGNWPRRASPWIATPPAGWMGIGTLSRE